MEKKASLNPRNYLQIYLKKGGKFLFKLIPLRSLTNFFFNRIPSCFNKSNIHAKTNTKEVDSILIKLNNTKKEIDEVYKNLLLKIKNDLISFIKFIDKTVFE